MDQFNCEKCGACCRAVKCFLLKDGLCSIYETRPDICRVDRMYEIRKLNMTREEYYKLTKRFCEILRECEHEV